MDSNRTHPKVSVVIPAYNEEKYIEDCVSSVQNQDVDFPYEIIVVNNASTDRTEEIARRLNIIVVNEPKKGLAYARQAGLDSAHGELLIYIDADTRFTKGWLRSIVVYLDAHKDVSCASCRFYFYDGRFIDNLGNFLVQRFIFPLMNVLLRMFNKPDIIVGLVMAMRTHSLRNVGINKAFVFFGEDIEMARRLSLEGKVRYLHHIYVLASARRYQERGIFKTIFLYWKTGLLILSGRIEQAQKFSHKHSGGATSS